MRFHPLAILCITFTVLYIVIPLFTVQAQTYIQYKIQINSDNSASWAITQVTDLSGPVDTWDGFQEKVGSLIEAASNITRREMSLDPNSLQISTLVSTNQSKTVEYLFIWNNFSVTSNGEILFGDAFLVNDFFNQLYGDGGLQISYPSTYAVQSVFPPPNEADNSTMTLEWFGTQFFINEEPNIILKNISSTPSASSSPSPNPVEDNGEWQMYMLIGIIATVAAVSSVGFYANRLRKRRNELTEDRKLANFPAVEGEEQKILNILQTNGGSAFQSAITEQSKFSKAKTSQLLSSLERKGVVTRYKRGRDKIVNLAEQGKEKNHEAR